MSRSREDTLYREAADEARAIVDAATGRFIPGLLDGNPDELPAVIVAARWHSGQGSALYSYLSCGAIDADAMGAELHRCAMSGNAGMVDVDAIHYLRAVVLFHGDRDSQNPWSPSW